MGIKWLERYKPYKGYQTVYLEFGAPHTLQYTIIHQFGPKSHT